MSELAYVNQVFHVLPNLHSAITMYKGPGLEDGEHVLMVPFRGWPESSVVEAALLATAIQVKPVY